MHLLINKYLLSIYYTLETWLSAGDRIKVLVLAFVQLR